MGTFEFDSRSVTGWVTFHLLDIAAVLVLQAFAINRLAGIAYPRWSAPPAG